MIRKLDFLFISIALFIEYLLFDCQSIDFSMGYEKEFWIGAVNELRYKVCLLLRYNLLLLRYKV